MLYASDHFRPFVDAPPATVMKLAPGEREVALLVYRFGGCTAKEIEARMGNRLTNATIRSMLARLVKKRIVIRRASGTYRTYDYLPAITNEYVRQSALAHLAEEHFAGSLPSMLATLAQMLELRTPAATVRPRMARMAAADARSNSH